MQTQTALVSFVLFTLSTIVYVYYTIWVYILVRLYLKFNYCLAFDR